MRRVHSHSYIVSIIHSHLRHMGSNQHTLTYSTQFYNRTSARMTGARYKSLCFEDREVICMWCSKTAVKDESVLIYLRRCGERSGAKMIWMINDPRRLPPLPAPLTPVHTWARREICSLLDVYLSLNRKCREVINAFEGKLATNIDCGYLNCANVVINFVKW